MVDREETLAFARVADFTESAIIADAKAKSWGKKALFLSSRSWLIHEEDGTPKGVMVCLSFPAPYPTQSIMDAWGWARFLFLPLVVVAGNEKPITIKYEELENAHASWNPYVAPGGILTTDFKRNRE